MGIIKSSLLAIVSSSDGGTARLGHLDAVENGNYNALTYNLDGFDSVTVNVPIPSYPLGRLDVVSDDLRTYNPTEYHLYAFDVVCVNIHNGEIYPTTAQSGTLCKGVIMQGHGLTGSVILQELFSFTPQTPATGITGTIQVQNFETGLYWYGYSYNHNGTWITEGYDAHMNPDGSLQGTSQYLTEAYQPDPDHGGRSAWALIWNNITQ